MTKSSFIDILRGFQSAKSWNTKPKFLFSVGTSIFLSLEKTQVS